MKFNCEHLFKHLAGGDVANMGGGCALCDITKGTGGLWVLAYIFLKEEHTKVVMRELVSCKNIKHLNKSTFYIFT